MVGQLEASPGASRNARGVIAATYQELQSIALLQEARHAAMFEKATKESLLRTVLQAVEIALFNMADLLRRARADVVTRDREACMTKLAWLRGFHRVLVRLSLLARDHAVFRSISDAASVSLPFEQSPGFREYLEALKGFDRSVTQMIEEGTLTPADALSNGSLASVDFATLHLARVANHESEIWERNLLATPAPTVLADYAEFVAAPILRHAVFEHVLAGDTYFTQFRGLHQIPELLAAEINDTIEEAILAIRDGELATAAGYLAWVNAMTQPIEACLPAMVDSLTTHDYHEIRENLGLTSGSHSVGIRYDMFTNLYEQLWEEALTVESGVADRGVFELLITQILLFRSFIFQWRDEHLHLPRNNLGGGGTKSLTGSPDAVRVVQGMSQHARTADPAKGDPILAKDGVRRGVLEAYLQEDQSLDTTLLIATGTVTQGKFTDVQERTGYFANNTSFTKPPARRAG